MNTTVQAAAPPRVPLTGARVPLLVGALILAVLAFQLNASLVSPALPAMAVDLGVDTEAISLVQSLFFLAGSVLGMITARWSDTIGRRNALLLCMGLLLLGSVIVVLAPAFPLVILGRILQGASSAAFTITFMVLGEELTPKQFAVSVGVVTAVNGGLGGLDGFIGGVITDQYGWRALFAVIVVVGVLACIGALAFVPKHRKETSRRMDWPGAITLGIVLICLTRSIASIASSGFGVPTTWLWIAGGVAAALAFAAIERRVPQPLIPLPVLRSRTVWPVLATTYLTVAGVFAATNFTIVVLSQDVAVGYGYSASLSGLLFLTPTAIAGLIAAPMAGWFAQRIGWIRSTRISTAVLVVLTAALALLSPSPWVAFAVLIAVGVFYLGQFQTAVHGLAIVNAPASAPGSLPGINGACFGLGASTGIAIVAPIANIGTLGAYQAALAVSAGLILLAFLASLLVTPETSSSTTDAPISKGLHA